LLDDRRENLLLAVIFKAMCWASPGFRSRGAASSRWKPERKFASELQRLQPAEVLVADDCNDPGLETSGAVIKRLSAWQFEPRPRIAC